MLDVNDICCSKIAHSFFQSVPTSGSFEIFRANNYIPFIVPSTMHMNCISKTFCHEFYCFQCCVSHFLASHCINTCDFRNFVSSSINAKIAGLGLGNKNKNVFL